MTASSLGRTQWVKQLNSSATFDFGFAKILSTANEKGLSVSARLIEPMPGKRVYGAEFRANQQSIVLMSPACDEEKLSPISAGASLLVEVLKRVRMKQQFKPGQTFIVPLAECGGAIPRLHWTILIIRDNDCYAFDPKGGAVVTTFNRVGDLLSSVTGKNFSLSGMLSQDKFTLQSRVPLYWQTDSENCGRFSGEIAGQVAYLLLSGKVQNLADLSGRLIAPQLEALIEASQNFMTDRRVMTSSSVRAARHWGDMESRVTRSELVDELEQKREKEQKLENVPLGDALAKKFFEVGEGGLDQLRADFLRTDNVYFNNIRITDLGFNVDDWAEALQASKEEAELIIAAHSQGPWSFIPFVLGLGMKEPSSLLIQQPTNDALRTDVIKEGNKFKLICTYSRFSIISINDNSEVGEIKDTVKTTYELSQNGQGQRGWLLVDCKTENQDVLRVLRGNLLSEQSLKLQYCRPEPAKSGKAETVVSNGHAETKEMNDDSKEILGLQREIQNLRLLIMEQQKALSEMNNKMRASCKETLSTERQGLEAKLTRKRASSQKTSKWKYLVVGGLIVLGLTACAFGITSLLGAILLAEAAAIALTTSGGVAALSGGIYAACALSKDNRIQREISCHSRESGNPPTLEAGDSRFRGNDGVGNMHRPAPLSPVSAVSPSSLFQEAEIKASAPLPAPAAKSKCFKCF